MPTVYRLYRLVDPETQETRYVGLTKHTLIIRFAEHLASHSDRYSPGLFSWLQDRAHKFPAPLIIILISEHLDPRIAKAEELRLIRYYDGVPPGVFNVKGTSKGSDLQKSIWANKSRVVTEKMREHARALGRAQKGTKRPGVGPRISAGLRLRQEKIQRGELPLPPPRKTLSKEAKEAISRSWVRRKDRWPETHGWSGKEATQ